MLVSSRVFLQRLWARIATIKTPRLLFFRQPRRQDTNIYQMFDWRLANWADYVFSVYRLPTFYRFSFACLWPSDLGWWGSEWDLKMSPMDMKSWDHVCLPSCRESCHLVHVRLVVRLSVGHAESPLLSRVVLYSISMLFPVRLVCKQDKNILVFAFGERSKVELFSRLMDPRFASRSFVFFYFSFF